MESFLKCVTWMKAIYVWECFRSCSSMHLFSGVLSLLALSDIIMILSSPIVGGGGENDRVRDKKSLRK